MLAAWRHHRAVIAILEGKPRCLVLGPSLSRRPWFLVTFTPQPAYTNAEPSLCRIRASGLAQVFPHVPPSP